MENHTAMSFSGGFTTARRLHENVHNDGYKINKKIKGIRRANAVKMESESVQQHKPVCLDDKQTYISRMDITKPLLIVAGPGSGKTTTLCARVQHMIDLKVDPSKIIVVTFSNKAAADLKDKIFKNFPESTSDKKIKKPWVSTLHTFCFQLIKQYYKHVGFRATPVICTSNTEQADLMRLGMLEINSFKLLNAFVSILPKHSIRVPTSIKDDLKELSTLFLQESKGYDPYHLKMIWKKVALLVQENSETLGLGSIPTEPESKSTKGKGRTTKTLTEHKKKITLDFMFHYDLYKDFTGSVPPNIKMLDKKEEKNLMFHIHKAHSLGNQASDYVDEYRESIEAYAWAKRYYNMIDFDDMLAYGNAILSVKEINKIVTSEFLYTLVDEFQDLNSVQMEMIMKLQQNRGWVTAVGDERQSIYGFRGATPINNFQLFVSFFLRNSFTKNSASNKDDSNDNNIVEISDCTDIKPQETKYRHDINVATLSDKKRIIIDLTDNDANARTLKPKPEPVTQRGFKPPTIIKHSQSSTTARKATTLNKNFEFNFESLNTNYRSNAGIVTLANLIIKESQYSDELIKKLRVDLFPSYDEKHQSQSSLHLWNFDNHKSEATYIANHIAHLINDKGYMPGDIAILIRSFRRGASNLTHTLQSALLQHGIEFVLRGGKLLLDNVKCDMLITFIRAIISPKDDMALKKLITKLVSGIGAVSISKIDLIEGTSNLKTASRGHELYYEEKVRIAIKQELFSHKVREKLRHFISIIVGKRKLVNKISLELFIISVYDTLSLILEGKDPILCSNAATSANANQNQERGKATFSSSSAFKLTSFSKAKDVEDKDADKEDYLEIIKSLLSGFSDTVLSNEQKDEIRELALYSKAGADSSQDVDIDVDNGDNDSGGFASGELKANKFVQKLVTSSSEASLEVIQSFVGYLAMGSDTSVNINNNKKVVISTIHQAKGLEWPVVFLPLFCEGIIPSTHRPDFSLSKSGHDKRQHSSSANLGPEKEHYEDELRLAYVAITRAKKELIFSTCDRFSDYGSSYSFSSNNKYDDDFELSSFIPSKIRYGGQIDKNHVLEYRRIRSRDEM